MPLRAVSLGTSLRVVGKTQENRNALLQYFLWAEACGVDGDSTGEREEIEQALATLHWWRQLRDGVADPADIERMR